MRKSSWAPLVFGLVLVGCSSDEDGGTQPTPTIGVSVDGEIVMKQGEVGSTEVTVTRGGGFTGLVTLSASNLPAGVTAEFIPATIPAGSGNGTSTVQLTASATAATGATTYSVTANGVGNLSATTTRTVTVNPSPDFSLAVVPATLNVQQGASGQTDLYVTRTGDFTGAVNLVVAGLPTGVTAAFSNAAPVGDMVLLTVTVGAGAATGTTDLTINGTGTPGTRSATLPLTVAPLPGAGSSNYKFCDLNNLPIWFAFQNGDGPWNQVAGVVSADGTTYSFSITESTGAYAWVTESPIGGTYHTWVVYGTQAQLVGGSGSCSVTNATRSLHGSVAGWDPISEKVSVAMGGGFDTVLFSTVPPNMFTLQNVLSGPADLIAVRSIQNPGPPITDTPNGIIIRRGLDIADGGTIPVLDFGVGAGEAFRPITAQVTVNNLGAEAPRISLGYQTTTTTIASLHTALGTPATQTVYGVPGSEQQATDLHMLTGMAYDPSDPGHSRGHVEWFKALADKTINLGPALTQPAITSVGNAPYARFRLTGPIQTEYDDVLVFHLTQGHAAGEGRHWSITAQLAYFSGANYSLHVPDMSAAGYLPLWGLVVGQETDVQTQAYGYSTFEKGESVFVEGGFMNFAYWTGKKTP